MAKQPEITQINSAYASQGVLNTNFTNIYEAFENTLSRDGTAPNNMLANLDMDGHDIINIGVINAEDYRVMGQPFGLSEAVTEAANSAVQALSSAGLALTYAERAEAAENSLLKWEGPWQPGALYGLGDITQINGSSYICVVVHLSTVFEDDLASQYWELFSAQGAAGAGTGDMLSTNNLSDVSNVNAARTNLGLGDMAVRTFTDLQATQQQWDTGTNVAYRFISPLQLHQKIAAFPFNFTPDYTSEPLTISPGGFYSLPVGYTPHSSRIEMFLVCVQAESGYVVNDRIPVSANTDAVNVNNGIAVAVKNDRIDIRFGTNPSTFQVLNMNTGTRVSLNNANWRLVITAWK